MSAIDIVTFTLWYHYYHCRIVVLNFIFLLSFFFCLIDSCSCNTVSFVFLALAFSLFLSFSKNSITCGRQWVSEWVSERASQCTVNDKWTRTGELMLSSSSKYSLPQVHCHLCTTLTHSHFSALSFFFFLFFSAQSILRQTKIWCWWIIKFSAACLPAVA